MPQIHYRANLSASVFPMTLAKAGTSVILPGVDQNFDRRVDAPGDTQRGSVGIPQALYLENVLPTPEGFQSVAFNLSTASFPSIPGNPNVVGIKAVYVEASYRTGPGFPVTVFTREIIFTNSTAVYYETSPGIYTYQDIGIIPSSASSIHVAVAGASTYIFVNSTSAVRVYELILTGTPLADVTNSIIWPPNPSLPAGNRTSIAVGAYNYLIIVSGKSVYWTLTKDFTPSLVTGSGNTVVNALKSNATFLRSHQNGFYIFSAANVVFAEYTGNSRYPWKFREVANSGGYTFQHQVSESQQDVISYGITNEGIVQGINPAQAENIAPEVSDFLERTTRIEIRQGGNNPTFPENFTLDYKMKCTGLYYVLNRYIIVAYEYLPRNASPETLASQAIVYDTLLKRYGKFNQAFNNILDTPRGVKFFNFSGRTVSTLEFAFQLTNSPALSHSGWIMLGKFQHERGNFISLEEIYVEASPVNANGFRNFQLLILPTLDGKTFLPAVVPYQVPPAANNTKNLKYLCHVTCQNFAILINGAFDLNTLELTYHVEGDR
jgi:hypothetical protein